MIEIKQNAYKGTRILLGNQKRTIINKMANHLIKDGYTEIAIPILQLQQTFANKVGKENNHLMFKFIDRAERQICLAPEYTAVAQQLATTYFKTNNDVKLFYIQQCFRGEKPQAGRYREFTQLGIEILNPTKEYLPQLIKTASTLIEYFGISNYNINTNVTRGLDYYTQGKGFEITYHKLGSAKQICGGGKYTGGIGFAIGIDRLLHSLS